MEIVSVSIFAGFFTFFGYNVAEHLWEEHKAFRAEQGDERWQNLNLEEQPSEVEGCSPSLPLLVP